MKEPPLIAWVGFGMLAAGLIVAIIRHEWPTLCLFVGGTIAVIVGGLEC